MNSPAPPQEESLQKEAKTKLPTSAHLMCGWPFLLVLFGGMIGGALGGLAYGINLSIYKSSHPRPAKVLLNFATGSLAFLLWLGIGIGIQAMRDSR